MALTDNRDTKERASPFAFIHEVVGIDSEEFYFGQLLQIELATGKVGPATAGSASGKQICGRCEERVTTGTSNTRKIKFKSGIFYWSGTGLTIGAVAYASDDSIVGATNTNPIAGRVYDIDANGIAVATIWPLPQLAPIGPTGV
jgi:hypothetical protein